jgi:hypothetical protein
MRPWVRSEYAPELAVVSAWLAALIPWNVTLSQLSEVGTVLFVRFPLFQVRYTYGIAFTEGTLLLDAYSAFRYQRGAAIQDAYAVWLLGAALVVLALALSVAMYVALDRVDGLLGRPVAAMGALLLGAGVVHAAATVLLVTRGFPGIPLPVGVVFEAGLGAVLLGARRV